MSQQSVLSIQNLSKTYTGGVQALSDVSLEIDKGEIFGLLGPNGAGKSTLIQILTSLTIKSQGKIFIHGVDFDHNPSQAKQYLGVVPQEFNFNMFERVEDIIVQQAGFYGVPRKVAQSRLQYYLEKLGLWEKRQAKAMELSGGMKRRLMIARALIHEPEILILDEPSAGVDVELRREMWEFVEEIHKQGKTIILTTHYLEEAENLCHRIGIINQGKILQVGTVTHLLSELQKDTLILDLDTIPDTLPERYRKLDETRVETDLLKGEDLWQVTQELHQHDIKILGIRNKSNRLEEVFLNKIYHE